MPFLKILSIVSSIIVTTAVISSIFEFRGTRIFENDISTYRCSELLVNKKSVAWVHGQMGWADGIVTQICEEQTPPYDGATAKGNVYGDVKDGWFVVEKSGRTARLILPLLGYFSNPSVCDRFAAYWGDRGDKVNALVISDIRSGKVIREIKTLTLPLETDNPSHLRKPAWESDCNSVDFDDERYIKKTTLVPSK